jgi:hypothetical protein
MKFDTPKAGWAIWLALIGGLLLVVAVFGLERWRSYKWEQKFWRSYAHYYYCDSAHRDDATCEALSNHVPPPDPPPKY